VSSAGTDAKDRWDKLQIFLQPVGGLLTAAAIAMFGFVTVEQARRPAAEGYTRPAVSPSS
jgi:hypothetical protein